jgi:hypothetical protein
MRHVRRVGHLIPVAALLALVTGCDCARVFVRFGSTDHTLAVGESFTAIVHFSGSGCGSTQPINDVVTWAAEDATIVRVDATTGRTTALRAGETRVLATGQTYGFVGSVRVIVHAP